MTTPTDNKTLPDWTKLEPHSLLDKLSIPLVSDDDIKHLKESIRALGLQHPIVLYEDKILDGRCRYKACIQLMQDGKFKFEDGHFVRYSGADPLEFVMSMYVDSRQQNESQRALIAAVLVDSKVGINRWHKHLTIKHDDAARMAKVSVAQIKVAIEVLARGHPDLVKAVRDGSKRLGYANNLIGPASKPVSKEDQKKELDKPPAPRSSKSGTATKKVSAANLKVVEFDEFKVRWRNLDEMQQRAFVEAFKDDISGYLDYINQQLALLRPTETPPIQPTEQAAVGS
jgi:ParB-like chromosome segregation protein Spo0J